MNGMTPFKAYWNTHLIGLKGGHSMVTEMRFDRINPPDTDRIEPRIGYGLALSYPGIILGDH